MITLMRKHHKVLMYVITALVCVSFSWYWNKTDFSQVGGGTAGKIYGRTVPQAELQRNSRLLRLASQLGMRDLVQALTLGAQTENEAFSNFSWNLMVLHHEAEKLGIQPTTGEIANGLKALPVFQGANGFDLAKYTDLTDHALAPMGFSEAEMEELVSDQISLQRVQKILGAGVSVVDSEMRANYERLYSKMDVATVAFKSADFANQVQVNDADVQKYFDTHKGELKSEARRQVKFVEFGLTDEQKKLTGKARIDALQKMADVAGDFTDAVQAKGADFDEVAAKMKLRAQETGPFSKSEPDPRFKAPELTKAAFELSPESPVGAPIQTPDGFYVERLAKMAPARPLTLEEAKPKIVETLKQERTQALMTAKADATAKQLREALKNGKSTEEAAAAVGVKLETLPAFALVPNAPGATTAEKPDPKMFTPEMQTLKQTVSEMDPGSVSDLVPQAEGGMLVVLEKREPLNATQFEAARPLVEARELENKNQVVFYEWLRTQRRAAGVEETQPQQAPS